MFNKNPQWALLSEWEQNFSLPVVLYTHNLKRLWFRFSMSLERFTLAYWMSRCSLLFTEAGSKVFQLYVCLLNSMYDRAHLLKRFFRNAIVPLVHIQLSTYMQTFGGFKKAKLQFVSEPTKFLGDWSWTLKPIFLDIWYWLTVKTCDYNPCSRWSAILFLSY